MYTCTVTGAQFSDGTPLTTLTPLASGLGINGDECSFTLDVDDIPFSAFTQDGEIDVDISVDWTYVGTTRRSLRALEEGGAAPEFATSGTTVVQVHGDLTFEKESLSTAAIAGIAAGASVIFLLVVFVMCRQGCFEDKRQKNKPPKTVAIEDGSETSTGGQS